MAEYFNYYFEPYSWMRTIAITTGVSSGVLFSIKWLLSRGRAVCKNTISLAGKTCIVTGANSGIGKAVAFEFAKRDARVILACRDAQKANAAATEIRNKLKHSNIEVYNLDLASFASKLCGCNKTKGGRYRHSYKQCWVNVMSLSEE